MAPIMKLLICIFVWILSTVDAEHSEIVNTRNGPVRGKREDGQIGYYGIPYAMPPLGDLRFRPPQPPDPWNTTFDALKMKSSCWQKHDRHNKTGDVPLDEDCLYLGVVVPDSIPKAASVLVWIHGGGFTWGTAERHLGDHNNKLTSHESVIFVAMNYRLGVFGFLAMNSPDAPGNMGLLDQQLALKWVHENIAAFGGDPDKITIAGVSAGGTSVAYHLFSPGSRGLYRRAILQSSYVLNHKRSFVSGGDAKDRSMQFSKKVNCDGDSGDVKLLQCLRGMPAEQLMNNQDAFTVYRTPFPPVIDGQFITDEPRALVKKAEFEKIPILLGTLQHETGDMTFRAGIPGLSANNGFQFKYNKLHDVLTHCFPTAADVSPIIEQYVKRNNSEPTYFRDLLMDITADYSYVCPSLEFATLYSNVGLPVYYYEFDHRPSVSIAPEWMGAVHGDEVPFLFGFPLKEGQDIRHHTIEEKALSKKMMRYWTNFARTGNPNTESENDIDENEWPQFGNDGKYILLNGNNVDKPTVLTKLRREYCDFWKQQSVFMQNKNLEELKKDEL
ncbi:cholinesterase-like [Saccoglossus kowalevskii]|uniref:Carboxylic ester hydrolase n=1 Tax=Saccoglossus kowalevskii TaxID=10224 RepID=A0ABM0H104_SACKO|nr:PREDICTED: cholinesterase-like [Saccoglossus kowalevskii]